MKKYIAAIILLVAGNFSTPMLADATGLGDSVELEGFAWSASAGWISMNCANDGLGGCATSDYKVQVETDGALTGYAWSSNVGWIKFGGLSGFPSGAATVAQDATANGTYPDLALNGWARACAGAEHSPSCSGSLNPNSGGWDGWISLSGSNHDITFVNGEATSDSFAWGGPNTIGWIDFSPFGAGIPPVTLSPVIDIVITSVTNIVGTTDAGGIYDFVSFFPSIQAIPVGETVDWELTLGTLSDNGTVIQTASGLDFSSTPTLTNVPFNVGDTLVFEVDMPEPGTVREINETNVYSTTLSLAFPAPVIVISGPEVVRAGEPVEIGWEVSAPYPVTCTAQGPGINETVVVVGVIGSPDTQTGSQNSAVLQNAARFEVSCVVGADTYTETYQVEVVPTFQEI